MGGGTSGWHAGIDLATRVGTPVLAVADGSIAAVYLKDPTFGRCLILRLADGRDVRYGHLSRIWFPAGTRVRAGQEIALSGNSGLSTGPHLHFEVLISPLTIFDRTPMAWALSH